MLSQHARPDVRSWLTVVIIDDEPLARRGIRRLIGGAPSFRVVGEAESGGEAREVITRLRPDIVLLDVRMPDGSGLDAIRAIPIASRPIAIFVSAHESHAVEAFDVRAVDYVLKPFTDGRLLEALDRAREAHELRRFAATELPVPDRPGAQIVVRSIGRTDLVRVDDVLWIEAVAYYARLHTATHAILHRESLESLEARLDRDRFVRVHRSAIVRLDVIRQVRRTRTGARELVLSTGARVAMSRRGWAQLRAATDTADQS
jgi:two-component system, LytTR family, response regulator